MEKNVDADLLAKARRRTPADPAVRACWDPVVLAAGDGSLTTEKVRDIVVELRAGRDVEFRWLRFEPGPDGLRVTYSGGHGGSCPTEAMCAELTRLADEPPPDPAGLVGSAIAWTHSGDAELPYRARVDGRNLTIRVNDFPAEPLYTLIADGVDLADLDDWPAAWRTPPTPASVRDLLADDPERRRAARAVGIGRLRIWSEDLCDVVAGDAATVARALGIPGTVVTNAFGALVVEPPPPGTTRVDLVERDGTVASVTITFAEPTLTRADFDTYFGHGQWLPRVHWDSDHQLAYHVEVAGAPGTCTVLPSFADEPTDPTPARAVLLRRDPR